MSVHRRFTGYSENRMDGGATSPSILRIVRSSYRNCSIRIAYICQSRTLIASNERTLRLIFRRIGVQLHRTNSTSFVEHKSLQIAMSNMQYISRLMLFIIGVGSLISCTAGYVPPVPRVEALSPAGVRFSIPHDDGITLMAVHAKINEQFYDLEAGTISRDVISPRNGRWIYEDHSTRLNIGDVIHYWIHVVRYGRGYNLLHHSYRVGGYSY